MADIVLRDRNGAKITYPGITEIKVNTADGGTQNFVAGDAVVATVDLDFSEGLMSVFPEAGELFSQVDIPQPETLIPENIRYGTDIAGIEGEFIGDTEEIHTEADFSDGNHIVVPTEETKVISKVTIQKPSTLVPENIAKDVDVGGVVGTFEGGGFDTDNLVEVFPVTEITVPSGGDGTVPVMAPLGLEAGSIYQIIWNGVGYIREAKNVVYNGIPAVALGNSIAWGGEDNGLPFVIGEIPEQYVSFTGGAYGLIIPLDGSTTFKVGGYLVKHILKDLPIALDFSTGNQTVTAPEDSLVKSVIIEKPSTLVPENIAKDANVAGVIGTHEGGGAPRLKPIRFYDPYGNVLYSFSRAEIQEMTELPPGPELGDLTFSKWTHTLAELKAVPYFADVGPCYQQNGSDVIVLIIDAYYYLSVNGSPKIYLITGKTVQVNIDWGDGSTSGGYNSTYYWDHTYTTPGRYIVTIKPTSASSTYIQLGYNSSTYYYHFAQNEGYSNAGYTGNPRNFPLISLLSGLSIPLDLYGCSANTQLKMFSSFSEVRIRKYGMASNLHLGVICGKIIKCNDSYCTVRNWSLKRYPNIANIGANIIFDECRDLEEVIFECTPDKLTSMNNQFSMLMTQTEPPALTASTTRTWGTKPIYVPDEAVEAYKTANVWSTVADYIYPASQYPD